MQITNTDSIPGKEIVEILGLAKGNTVRAKWFGKDIMAGLRNLVGGELIEYTEMLTEAR
ncbi:MAG: YbjQ family protein, partial [Euryarchaeota archaeon]|nr:YbjQ family protein [Euryarchaeota archaeon]